MFEDSFGRLIGELVNVCLEYSSGIVDGVYIYMNFTDDKPFSDFFFSINDNVVDKYFICTGENMCEAYIVENYVYEKSGEIREAFKRYNKNMPLEIKITYDILKNNLNVDSNYIDYKKAEKDTGISNWIDCLNLFDEKLPAHSFL